MKPAHHSSRFTTTEIERFNVPGRVPRGFTTARHIVNFAEPGHGAVQIKVPMRSSCLNPGSIALLIVTGTAAFAATRLLMRLFS